MEAQRHNDIEPHSRRNTDTDAETQTPADKQRHTQMHTDILIPDRRLLHRERSRVLVPADVCETSYTATTVPVLQVDAA